MFVVVLVMFGGVLLVKLVLFEMKLLNCVLSNVLLVLKVKLLVSVIVIDVLIFFVDC